MENFDNNLRYLMYSNRLSAKILALKLGVSEASVSNWKRGLNKPGFVVSIKLADILDCSMNYLFGRSENDVEFKPGPLPPFSERLREVMLENGENEYRLRLQNVVSSSRLHDWLRGKRLPEIGSLCVLAEHFGITLDELVGRI